MRHHILLLAVIACGGSGNSQSTSSTVTFSSAGASPASLSVASGAEVTFTNSDTTAHQVASTACPELASSSLAHGQSFTATLGTGPKSCAWNDALNAAISGTITVAAPTQAGH